MVTLVFEIWFEVKAFCKAFYKDVIFIMYQNVSFDYMCCRVLCVKYMPNDADISLELVINKLIKMLKHASHSNPYLHVEVNFSMEFNIICNSSLYGDVTHKQIYNVDSKPTGLHGRSN